MIDLLRSLGVSEAKWLQPSAGLQINVTTFTDRGQYKYGAPSWSDSRASVPNARFGRFSPRYRSMATQGERPTVTGRSYSSPRGARTCFWKAQVALEWFEE